MTRRRTTTTVLDLDGLVAALDGPDAPPAPPWIDVPIRVPGAMRDLRAAGRTPDKVSDTIALVLLMAEYAAHHGDGFLVSAPGGFLTPTDHERVPIPGRTSRDLDYAPGGLDAIAVVVAVSMLTETAGLMPGDPVTVEWAHLAAVAQLAPDAAEYAVSVLADAGLVRATLRAADRVTVALVP